MRPRSTATPESETPRAPEAPRPLLLLREAGAGLELLRLAARLPALSRLPRGNGEPVLVLPGFGAGDGSTAILRALLTRLGYHARGWGLGRNTGDVPVRVRAVAEVVARRARDTGLPLRLVGWSLGGVLAREVARELPQHVDRVVTLGSPVVGGPRYTATAGLYRATGADLDAIETAIAEREQRPIRVPITAIYSRSDGIVDWRACIDRTSPYVEHVEVRTTHIGLGFAPEVLRIVAERLAAPVPRG